MTLAVEAQARIGDFRLRARFALPPGLTVLFGPSGAGKTRLLRLVAGLDTLTDGQVSLDGTVFDDTRAGVRVEAHERRIGMVFQQPYLLPHRTAVANVALAVRTGSRADRRRRAHELLVGVDADALADRRPSEMSGGQRQRIALARALAGEPRLLLLDEPFNALDLPVRRQLRTLVRELTEQAAVPTVFVTHDPDELVALADQVLVADHGRIEDLVDPPTALRRVEDPGVGGDDGAA